MIPGTRRRTRIEFRGPAQKDANAATPDSVEYTLVGKEVSPLKERTLVVPGVRLKRAGP